MQLNDYSTRAIATDLFDDDGLDITAPAFLEKVLGLVGESGEVADKIKKLIRDHGSEVTDAQKAELAKELGDVLWYVNSIAVRLGYSLDDVAQMNLDKLASRQSRDVLRGQGDNR